MKEVRQISAAFLALMLLIPWFPNLTLEQMGYLKNPSKVQKQREG